jgi:Ferritin-like domain
MRNPFMSLTQKHSSGDQPSNEVGFSRRRFLGRTGSLGAVVALAGTAGLLSAQKASAQPDDDIDPDILNFALNLEYLEAEYYLRAATGTGIAAHGVGVTGVGTLGTVTIKADPKVSFDNAFIKGLAMEIASNELDHVSFLRSALGDYAVAEPSINLEESFNTLAKAAGLRDKFNPFADATSFLIGAFIFEDVGVTAYNGAAPLITSSAYLAAAASILAVEAYHAGIIRALLYERGAHTQDVADKISALRNTLSNSGTTDQGIRLDGKVNLIPADSNALAFSRTTREVLNIVYGGINATEGLFFPDGMNGTIH